jgi:hypothetical protein
MGESKLRPRDIGTTVVPIRPGIVVAGVAAACRGDAPTSHRWAICPVSWLRTLVNEFAVECACGVVMHEECYWGRLVQLAEWQDCCRTERRGGRTVRRRGSAVAARSVRDVPGEGGRDGCLAPRQLEGLGKEGA